ncbi:IclR family transcriptional regulator [Janibacter sp. G349]|uniref:IclR family transcriptional regulator n=1 Tax=unclassified Janibacter TaxID=2649294 RepID=UPI0020CED849|nr:helix-turn-helix domain-containing protein [Janibacter sp. CX7]UTT67270.1 helix-turn-helix domain-containing protein [Janibacter sp. CX7]
MSTLQTLDRGLEAIEIISRRTSGTSPAALADELGVHRAGAYRVLATLEQRHLVAKGSDGLYRLGSGALAYAGRFMSQYRLAAQPLVQDLADGTGCTAFVSIADRDESVAVAVAEPGARGAIGISYQIGTRHPIAHGADGIAILAQRPAAATDAEAVRVARELGYAVSDGQVQPGTVGLAIGTGSIADEVEGSIGVIRLGAPADLDIDSLLPHVQRARDLVSQL